MSLRIGVVSLPWERPPSVVTDPPLRTWRAPVIGTFDASAADAAHRGHALLIAGVIAGLGPAPGVVECAPGIIVGGLGMARHGGGQQDGTDDHEVAQTHGNLPAVAPI